VSGAVRRPQTSRLEAIGKRRCLNPCKAYHVVGSHAQRLASETLSTRSQPIPLIIREPQPSAAQPARKTRCSSIRYAITSCCCRLCQLARAPRNNGATATTAAKVSSTDEVHASGDASAEFWGSGALRPRAIRLGSHGYVATTAVLA
jgi:hypothetical protein